MKNIARLLVFVSFLFFGTTPAAAGSAQLLPSVLPPPIIVGLAYAEKVTISCQGPFTLESAEGTSSVTANQEVTLHESQGKAASGSWVYEGCVVIYPDEPQTGAYLLIKGSDGCRPNIQGTGYRGRIIVMPAEGKLLIANIVDIESYTKSVVSSEMSDNWPWETLKAQAVAARTYAAYKTGMANIPGFGLTPDCISLWADDQVYKGVLAERTNGAKATESTRGEILTYSGSPIAAYFHSSAEGMTETTRAVWGGDVPYLMAVEEVPYESPYVQWVAEYYQDDLWDRLSGLGAVSPIEAIWGVEAGQSGRWYGIMAGSQVQGMARLKATDVRNALGVPTRSLLFSSYSLGNEKNTTGLLNPCLDVCVQTGSGLSTVKPGTARVAGAAGVMPPCSSQGLHVVSGICDTGELRVVLKGKGYGHGIGLSQWGARAMALLGYDYGDILDFYYPKTTKELWW